MTIRKYYIGSLGPFLYDDTDLINDPDGDFAGEDLHGFITDGPVKVDSVPAVASDVLRFDDIGALIVSPKKIIETFSTTGTIALGSNIILATGTYDLFLPTLLDGHKRVYHIKNIGSGIVTLKPNISDIGAEIENEISQVLRSGYNITTISDLTDWWIL